MSERQPPLERPSDRELLEALLTVPGSVGETYSRFHNYSQRNLGFLALQGCAMEPIATYKKWSELGRQVKRGSKAYSILRPIQVRVGDRAQDGAQVDQGKGAHQDHNRAQDEPKFIQRFKVVRAIFSYSQTEGEELPELEPREWSTERALGALAIQQVPFQNFDGNIGGYAVGREIAINPLAPFPLKTALHEMSHIEHGHTTEENLAQYQEHRGLYEFEAEATAHLALNTIGEMTDDAAEVSRGYIQGWLRHESPPEQSLRRVLNVSTKLVNAGYEGRGE